jgi:hypothetical protein
MKFLNARFDYSRLEQSTKDELQDFFIHYNSVIDNLQQILNSGINIDNLNGQYKTINVRTNTLTVIDGKAKYASIVSADNEIDTFKIIKSSRGIEIQVTFKTGDTGNITLLLLN